MWRCAAAGLVGLALASAAEARGQGAGGGQTGSRGPSRPEYARMRGRPAVSPYLNMLRGGSSPALNYYNLVRPQVDQYRGFQTQGYEIGRLNQEVAEQGKSIKALRPDAPVRATGHPSLFFDYTHYFPGSPRGPVNGRIE